MQDGDARARIGAMASMLAWTGAYIGKPAGWERVVRLLAPPASCPAESLWLTREGFRISVIPRVLVGWHILFFGSYEPELRAIFRQAIAPGTAAIDIGANLGWHTLLMARAAGKEGLVLAAEPNASIREQLATNLAANSAQNVVVVPAAIGERAGEAPFLGPPASDPASGSGHLLNAEEGSTARVPVVTLDSLASRLQGRRVSLVKIDVEGYEWPVLQGGRELIANHRPHMVFEHDVRYCARGGGSSENLQRFFDECGYRLFAVGRGAPAPIEATNWPENANVWAQPTPVQASA